MNHKMEALIKRRRSQMLVHSYLYYWMYQNIVSDHQFDTWAVELRELQADFPEPIGFYDEVFADWKGETGMHLPRDPWIKDKALKLAREHEHRISQEIRPNERS